MLTSNTTSTLHDRLQANAAQSNTNWCGDEFEAIIDLVEMKCFKYTNDLGTEIEEIEIPEDHLDRAEEARASLIEAVAETSDELMEKYLGDEEISVSELKEAIRQATTNVEFTYPVLCGTAFKTKVFN